MRLYTKKKGATHPSKEGKGRPGKMFFKLTPQRRVTNVTST